MNEKDKKQGFVLGLDVSTKTLGIALFEDLGNKGKLKLLHHVSPKIKPAPKDKVQELCDKARIFETEFLDKYVDFGITDVIIEEPLLRSNNVYTVATLLRFNGMICRSVYEKLGVVPQFVSSYNARAFGFPELMGKRTHKKDGTAFTEKQIEKKKSVLFGNLPYDIDKKDIIWNKVADIEPLIKWLYTPKMVLKKENYDMTDAYVAVTGFMRQQNRWP